MQRNLLEKLHIQTFVNDKFECLKIKQKIVKKFKEILHNFLYTRVFHSRYIKKKAFLFMKIFWLLRFDY